MKKKPKPPGNPQYLVRIPEAIGEPLRDESTDRELTPQAVIIDALAERYGVEVELPIRGKHQR